MTTSSQTGEKRTGDATREVIISADSHIMEPHDFWEKRVPEASRGDLPKFSPGGGFDNRPGGYDPTERIKEMEVDTVSAEVLYPTLGLRLFHMEDSAAQEQCFRVSNDWMMEYCSVAPDRLVGIATLSMYNVDHAVKELERCRKGGLPGAMIWSMPHPDLPFSSDHYDRFWAAAQDMDVPVSLHILTGHGYMKNLETITGLEAYRTNVNTKLQHIMDCLVDLIFAGVLERFPRLKLVLVEYEIGWLPFVLQQWDYYYQRFRERHPIALDRPPSDYFYRQIYTTFFNDAVGGQLLSWWGTDTCMWSNDYPHGNSTWPHSRDVIGRDLGHLPSDARAKLVRDNVTKLYSLKIPAENTG